MFRKMTIAAVPVVAFALAILSSDVTTNAFAKGGGGRGGRGGRSMGRHNHGRNHHSRFNHRFRNYGWGSYGDYNFGAYGCEAPVEPVCEPVETVVDYQPLVSYQTSCEPSFGCNDDGFGGYGYGRHFRDRRGHRGHDGHRGHGGRGGRR